VVIAGVWGVGVRLDPYRDRRLVEITEKNQLRRLVDAERTASERRQDTAFIVVPTGVWIQALEFESQYNVKVVGMVWQRYPEGTPKEVRRGVLFPESVSDMSETLLETHRETVQGEEVIGWRFNVSLRQTFNYGRYPFDKQDVWLRLWAAERDQAVLLVPDLSAYKLMTPTARPGVDADIVLTGFHLESTFFSFVPQKYGTDFGLGTGGAPWRMPELYFTMLLRRDVWPPFVSYFLPLVVISGVLFSIHLMTSREPEKVNLYGFSISNAVLSCSGLFFSVILLHAQARGQAAVKEIMYLEYYFFAMYAGILYVSMNAFILSTTTRFEFLTHHDSRLSKLLFWPAFLAALLAVTIWQFF
jgi:hypothetical protein